MIKKDLLKGLRILVTGVTLYPQEMREPAHYWRNHGSRIV